MKLTLLSLLVSALTLSVSALHPHDAERLALIQKVNSANVGWKAAESKFMGQSWDQTARLCGVLPRENKYAKLPPLVHTSFDIAAIPDEFDARKQWPNCPTIGEIRDQSDCGSCWAFGAVEAASDRICIETNGASKPHLSAEDLLSCCDSCGNGCNGGDPSAAWSYFTSTGVVTGGNFNDFSWCSSYSMPNCDHHDKGRYGPCPSQEYSTPACPTQCDANSTYTIPFAQDKHVFATSYSINSDMTQIQQEIMTNGPVEAAFTVYQDFELYSGGVYSYVSGEQLGGHAVRIFGWGVENGIDYWLVANSWNTDWGVKGTFKIKRGTDECGIEDDIVAGKFHA